MARDPLRQALRAQRAAARQGFDWPAGDPRLWAKVAEELDELRRARRNRRRAAEELGDLLFAVVNVARHLGVRPDVALRATIGKFERRLGYVLRHARGLPPKGDARRLARMDALWRKAKRGERGRS